MKRTILTVITAVAATLLVASPASAMKRCPTEDSVGPCHWNAHKQGNGHGTSITNYPHHPSITGDVALTPRMVRNAERIVHHLHYCDWPREVVDCKNKIGHRRSNASINADRVNYYFILRHGRIVHAERYSL